MEVTIESHEITSQIVNEEGSSEITYFDEAFNVTRTEVRLPTSKGAESGRRGILNPAPHTTGPAEP